MNPAILQLVTLSKVKDYLDIASGVTIHDAGLTSLINEVSDDFEKHCNRKFALGDHLSTELFDIGYEDEDTIQLKCFPVWDIVGLSQSYTTEYVGYLTTDFVFYSELGQVKLLSGSFPKGKQIISVSYHAGFCAVVPPRLQSAVKEEIAVRFNSEGDDNLKKEKISDYSYEKVVPSSTFRSPFSPRVTRILDDFRDVPL